MASLIKKGHFAYKHTRLRLLSFVLAAVMLIAIIPISILEVYADNGGFTLGISWQGTSSKTDYVYDSDTNENQLVRMRVSYRNESPSRGYNPGELVITVKGLGDASRDGKATPIAIAADPAANSTKSYDWSYTYSEAVDTYTFTNNKTINPSVTLDGMFEIVWNLNSRETVDNYSTTLSAKMRTAYNEQVISNGITYSQQRVEDTYTVDLDPSPLYAADGLTDALPAGTTDEDYRWVNYDVIGNGVEKSLAIKDKERFDLWFLPDAIVQSPKYTLVKNGRTKTVNGVTYEGYSISSDVNVGGNQTYLEKIIVAYPKSKYENQNVTALVDIMGTYNESTSEQKLASNSKTLNLSNYDYIEGPGYPNSYTLEKYLIGISNDFTNSHCDKCKEYGAINADHLAGGHEYYATLALEIFMNPDDGYYKLELTDDFLDIERKDGTIRQLRDDEYNFTGVAVFGTDNFVNQNGVHIKPDVYPVEIYIRREGESAFETTPHSTSMLTKSAQFIPVPDDTVGVRIVIKNFAESLDWCSLANVYYKFHTDDTDIRTNSGRMINNIFYRMFDQDNNWINHGYEHNRATYGSDREYQRDLDTYGETFDRVRDDIHILEIPNEYRTGIDFEKTSEDRYNYYFNGDLSSKFIFSSDGTVNKVSQYTIVPEGLELSNALSDPTALLNNLTFSGPGVTEKYLRDHCTPEIIENYKGSGRTYIALHYDFSDDPKMLQSITASGIQMYSPKSKIDTDHIFTMYSATQVESGTGKWFTRYTDNYDVADELAGIWHDIDRDSNKTEQTDFDKAQVPITLALSSEIHNIKLVDTSTTPTFVSPVKDEITDEYQESEIPIEYSKENYKYSLTFGTGNSRATGIVLYDVLEPTGEWQGEFVGIDYQEAAAIIGTTPTIYYSSASEVIAPEPNLHSGGWTTSKPAFVKSIAVDFGSGVLNEGKEIRVIVTMKAPECTNDLKAKIAENKDIAYYTPIDSNSGIFLSRKDLPSNEVPIKLMPYMGTIRLTKTDEVSSEPVLGAVFSLYEQKGATPNPDTDGPALGSFTTDASGSIKTQKLVYGKYYFIETAAPKGYLTMTGVVPVNLDGESPEIFVDVTAKNQRKPGQLSIEKYNVRDHSIKVAGAEFSLFNENGEVLRSGLKTGDNGILTVTNLEWGIYYLQETKAPTGYELNPEKIKFDIYSTNDAGADLGTTPVSDPQKPASAVLTKYEVLEDGKTQTAETLDGAAYELYHIRNGLDDEFIGTYMTDDDGKIYADGLAFGDYYFIETIVSQGYELNTERINFTVTAENTDVATPCSVTTTDTRTPGRVWVKKVDDEGKIVKGAEYGLYKSDDNTLITSADFANGDATTGLFITSDEGIIEIEGLRWGEYYFKETKAPKGYELSEETYPVSVNRETVNDRLVINMTDSRGKGSVKLIKVDEDTESIPLKDAEFSLYKSDGTLVYEGLTTGEDGTFTVNDLLWGSYYFTETKAPLGYGLNPNKIRFSVNFLSVGMTQEITVTDPAVTLDLEVTKRIKTSDIVFAHGVPTFTFKLNGTDINNETRTMYQTVSFSQSFYDLHKTEEFLELTTVFSGLIAGNYNVSEMETQRYALDGITDISASGSLAMDQKSVDFDLVHNSTGSATFFNDKINQELTTHTSQVTNIVGKSAKLTALVADWRGGKVTSETLDRTKLDVYAYYDDGTVVKLEDDDYDLDPTTFDSSMNGDYTVTAKYTEGGITRSDTFQVSVNLPVPFTWLVSSDSPVEYNGKNYDGTVYITGYTGDSKVVQFPTEVSGIRKWNNDDTITFDDNGKTYRVVSIGSNENIKKKSAVSVENIIVPSGIDTIGDNAFNGWTTLKDSLDLSASSLTSIGNSAFSGCTALTGLKLPNTLETIKEKAFYTCSGMTGALAIPNSVKTIGDSAFDMSTNGGGFTGTLTLGTGLQTIGKKSFYNCNKFTGNLVIPNSVKTIGDSAFYMRKGGGFTGTLTLGTGLQTIGENAFYYCSKFTGSLTIPSNVTSIGAGAFWACLGFNGDLNIQANITRIENNTFNTCRGFTGTLTLPSTLKYIGRNAFDTVQKIHGDLIIPNGVTTIDNYAFNSMGGINGNIVIPNTVTTIGDDAFFGFLGMTSGTVTVPASVKTIGIQGFRGWSNFTGTLIIKGATSIGSSAFEQINTSAIIHLPSGLSPNKYGFGGTVLWDQ